MSKPPPEFADAEVSYLPRRPDPDLPHHRPGGIGVDLADTGEGAEVEVVTGADPPAEGKTGAPTHGQDIRSTARSPSGPCSGRSSVPNTAIMVQARPTASGSADCR